MCRAVVAPDADPRALWSGGQAATLRPIRTQGIRTISAATGASLMAGLILGHERAGAGRTWAPALRIRPCVPSHISARPSSCAIRISAARSRIASASGGAHRIVPRGRSRRPLPHGRLAPGLLGRPPGRWACRIYPAASRLLGRPTLAWLCAAPRPSGVAAGGSEQRRCRALHRRSSAIAGRDPSRAATHILPE